MPGELEDRLGLTEDQWAIFQKAVYGFGEQDENGVDLSHLRANLRLTPTQRLEKHQQALARMREVRRAGIAAGLYRGAESAKRE